MEVINPGDRIVSYTQFSMYQQCPKSWELAYARRLRKKEPSIHLLFGTAIHNTIQEWLLDRFSSNPVMGELQSNFGKHMAAEYNAMVDEWGSSFTNDDELYQFFAEGMEILKCLGENIDQYFPIGKLSFLGYEVPLICAPVKSRPTVKLKAFLDLVFVTIDQRFKIMDIKTSTKGWSQYQMNDRTKISQLALYKYFYALLSDTDVNSVDVEYLILKRQFLGGDPVQEFKPLQTIEFVARIAAEFEDFIITCFDESGNFILDREYVADSGINGGNCRFCDFADDENLCPVSKRK